MKEVSKHSRMINNAFLEDLSEGGILFPVTELLRSHMDELLMAFRGSYINVYYRGHSLYRIEQQKRAYSITFDFNHARYTEKYEDILKELMNIGMQLPAKRREIACDYLYIHFDKDGKEKKETKSGNNGLAKSIVTGEENHEFWKRSYELLKQIVDDFYDPEKMVDYFKDDYYQKQREEAGLEPLTKRKSIFLEKQRQQSIALINRATDNGYYIYDIEYAQPTEKQGDEKAGRYDMLALTIEDHKAKQVLFVELKSTESACTSGSGVEKHQKDMVQYMADDNKEVIGVRKRDAEKIMEAFHRLFGIGEVDFSELVKDTRCAFLYTDGAKKYHAENFQAYQQQGAIKHVVLNEPWEIRAL